MESGQLRICIHPYGGTCFRQRETKCIDSAVQHKIEQCFLQKSSQDVGNKSDLGHRQACHRFLK